MAKRSEQRKDEMIYTTVHIHIFCGYFAAIQCSVADLCVYNQFDLLPVCSDCDMHTVFAIKENITWKPENSTRFFKSIQELWWLLFALFLLD